MTVLHLPTEPPTARVRGILTGVHVDITPASHREVRVSVTDPRWAASMIVDAIATVIHEDLADEFPDDPDEAALWVLENLAPLVTMSATVSAENLRAAVTFGEVAAR